MSVQPNPPHWEWNTETKAWEVVYTPLAEEDPAAGSVISNEALSFPDDWKAKAPILEDIPPASLPYAGTSGWSGSDASRERAEDRDTSGKTARLQHQVETWLDEAGTRGRTIKDAREAFPTHHHGSLSGTLTDLHQDNRAVRLTEKRDRCSVYVTPRWQDDREAVAPKKRASKVKEVVLTTDMDAEFVGHLVIAALQGHDKITVRGPA